MNIDLELPVLNWLKRHVSDIAKSTSAADLSGPVIKRRFEVIFDT